ncbi:MAG: hypothetical protein QM767_03000 [Anaeromyxobacter sp.]
MKERSRGISAAMTRVGLADREQAFRQSGDRLRRRTLTHAHQHQTIADRHDVAALQADARPRIVGRHERRTAVTEPRMKPVDRLHIGGFRPARGPMHGADTDRPINPAGTVACEKLVRQGRQHEILRQQCLAGQSGGRKGQLRPFDAADQQRRKLLVRQFVQPAAQFVHHVVTDQRGSHAAVEQPFARFRLG